MDIRRIFSLSSAVAVIAGIVVVVVAETSPVLADTGCPTAVAATQVSGVYEIDTAAKLQWVKDAGLKTDSYKLTANINMSGCTWSTGIGTNATPFSGTFNGNSKTISNLALNGASYLGLFSYVTGSISDLTLASPTVTSSNQMVGALVGELRANGSVSSITITNTTVSAPSQFAGGAFGKVMANSTVNGLTISGSVSSPQGVAGGVAAYVEGTLTDVHSTATVSGSFNVGGIAGSISNTGLISNSSSSGTVTGTSSEVGGAVGQASGTLPNCATLSGVTTSGTVSATGYVGGLIGYGNCYYVVRSSSSASITSSGAHAGGLVGYDNYPGDIRGSFFTGQVQATESAGGLGGLLRSVIADSYSTGSVTVTSGTNGGRAGGLVGWFRNPGIAGFPNASITNSFASGLVTPPSSGSTSTTGGLVGDYQSGTITKSVWDRTTTGRSTSGGTGATGYTTQQLRDYVLYNSDNLNWNITDGISTGNGVTSGTTWSICSGAASGYPFLTRQNLTGTCRPTMAYNGNVNTGGTAPSDGSTPYTSGDTVTVLGNTGSLTKTGNIFLSWNTKADGSGTTYAAGDTFTITSPVMLFAQWASAPTIYYRANGGTGTIANQTASTGTSITLSSGVAFTQTGYTLSRWDTSAFGNGTPYALGQTITMPAGGLNLWAVWTTNPVATTTIPAATTTTPPQATTTVPSSSGTTTPAGTTPSTSPASSATSIPQSQTTIAGGTSSSGGQATQPTVAKSNPVQNPSATTTVAETGETTTTVTQQSDVPDVDGVGSSEAGATVGGKPAQVEVTDQNGSIVVTVGEATVRYSVTDPSGIRRVLASTSAAEVQPGDTVTIEMGGFATDADATAWLVPGDIPLGSVTLKAGAGSITGKVPDDATAGVRRIVAASQSVDDEPLVVAYGVEVADTSGAGPSWSLVFLIFLGLAAIGGLLIPAVRRRREEEK